MTDQPSRLAPVTEAPVARQQLEAALFEIKRVIVGQEGMLERVLVALLSGGHLLLEGVPGLAKTRTIATLAQVLGGSFQRIQFTPDLVPSDLVGTRIWRPDQGGFETELGPVHCNFLLADEINRAPAKVQSALLEVMQEHQVTIGKQTFPVPAPFLVLATQNPIESDGTYPLPEAQVDRFLMKVVVDYPNFSEEMTIVARSLVAPPPSPKCCRWSSCRRCRPTPKPSMSTGWSPSTPSPSVTPPATPPPTNSPTLAATSLMAPHPEGPSTWSRPPAPWPCCGAAATACPKTSKNSPATSCATAWS